MLKKELRATLALIGVMAPFTAQADQPMSSTSGQANQSNYTAGEALPRGSLPGAYSQNANYNLDNSYDVYFTANFIYWNLQQDITRVGNLMDPDSSGAIGLLDGTCKTLFSDTSYKPGFQVGLGFNMNGMDGWNLYSEYTWYKNTTSSTTNAGSGDVIAVDLVDHAAPSGITDDVVVASSVSGESKYHFNNLNVSLQRPFYWGRKVTANVGAGLRALWISQTVTGSASGVTSYPSGSLVSGSSLANSSSSFTQKSWALGPRFELETNWMLGAGFRIMADMAASVLYTKYTSLNGSVQGGVTDGITADLSSNTTTYNTLRAVTETSLGLGWGSYFGDNNDFHFDLSASYEFNIYWNQNMADMVINGHGSPSNTYLRGLNIAARIDF